MYTHPPSSLFVSNQKEAKQPEEVEHGCLFRNILQIFDVRELEIAKWCNYAQLILGRLIVFQLVLVFFSSIVFVFVSLEIVIAPPPLVLLPPLWTQHGLLLSSLVWDISSRFSFLKHKHCVPLWPKSLTVIKCTCISVKILWVHWNVAVLNIWVSVYLHSWLQSGI